MKRQELLESRVGIVRPLANFTKLSDRRRLGDYFSILGVINQDYSLPPHQVPLHFPRRYEVEERDQLKAEIRLLLADLDAVLIAHYYVGSEIQDLALETGGCVSDSLEMARYGRDHSASTLVVAGVRFMGETAKILSPTKRVLMPTLKAECSLDLGCPPPEFEDFCKQHPDRTVVVYANTSVEVKALSDWVVTSSIGLEIVSYLSNQGKKLIWAPDKHLGTYIQIKTGADMVLWSGACVVHEEFKFQALLDMKAVYPEAGVLVHPESPAAVIDIADCVGSTSQLLKAAGELPMDTFIVATDRGMFHQLRLMNPHKSFIEAPTVGDGATCRACAHCPWMAMNELHVLRDSLQSTANEIHVDPDTGARALTPLQRMLDFSRTLVR